MIALSEKQFHKAATFASSVIGRRNTIPVLTMLKVTANGSLALEGTDLDMHARAVMPYDGDETEFLLNEPRKVLSAIKRAGAETVSFAKGESLEMEAGELTANFGWTIPAEDFPSDNGIAEETLGATVGADFFAMLHRVRPAISKEETRYYLNGIFIRKVADWLYRLVATDGHRLFMADVPLPDATGELGDGVIIPRRAIERALSAFSKAADGVRFSVGRSALSNQKDKTLSPGGAASRAGFSAEIGGIKMALTTKLIDGTYPDYARVIPTECTFTIRLNRAALIKAVKSLTPLATDKTRAIRIAAEKGRVLIELHSPDIGKSRFPVAAEHKAPKEFYFGLNARYLLEALNALTGEEVEFGLTDASAPLTITDPADTAFKIVQMPMRI